ncbi:dockerin type I domain-containing protein [Bacterioplanoides sp.]|uniref:dockerin type I domain-containing protein n=1 Tax=Bacterioplanoides sp. TaxID=2066072 RepID=UPI003B5B6AC3
MVRWIGSGVHPVEVLDNDIANGIVNVEDKYINYFSEDGLYTCENNIQNSADFSYRDYIELMISKDNPLYDFYYSYPLLPNNLDSLIRLGEFEDRLPIGSGIEDYKNFVETYILPDVNDDLQQYKDTRTKFISCVEGSKTLIATGVSAVAETMIVDGSLRTLYFKNLKTGDTNFLIPNSLVSLVYNHESKLTSSISEEILNLMEGSDYLGLIEISRNVNSEEFGELFEEFPNLGSNHEEYGLNPNTSKEEYVGYVANILINNIPFNKSSNNAPFRLPYVFHYNDGQIGFNAGLINFNGISKVNASVTVASKSLLIDPYTNPISSIDIVTNGELFAADVSCTVAGPMDITSAEYGNWGGSERLTLPLQWTSKDAKGVVSLKGDVDSVSGEQQLLVLDTLAEVTTADVTINCAATLSDKNGNQLNVNLIPATIRLNVDENGRFEFDELRDGDFTINVKSEHYTQSCINTQTTGSQIDLGNIELIAGDVNNDGEINIDDFTYLAGRYGSAKGDERYTTLADLNSDNKVNIQDLAILGSHFGSRQCNP